MSKVKIAVTLEEDFVSEMDDLVRSQAYPSRSRIVEEAVAEKLRRRALYVELEKVDATQEQAVAEEGLGKDVEAWPEY